MNSQNAKDYLPYVQALSEGKTIQEADGSGSWWDLHEPVFSNPPGCYRIKPEPRRVWINVYHHGLKLGAVHTSQESAERNKASNRIECVEFVEVVK